MLQQCLKCESNGKTLSTGPSPSRRFVGSCSDSTVRGVRMVDPRQCSVARAVIMEHYRILVSPASCRGRGRDTAAVGTGVSWRGNYSHAACSILVKILIKQNGHHLKPSLEPMKVLYTFAHIILDSTVMFSRYAETRNLGKTRLLRTVY